MQIVDSSMKPIENLAVKDLGPLSWVLEELRKSFDASNKALKRFLQETKNLPSDLAAVDVQQLRTSKTNLHQAKGALTLLEQMESATFLEAMEAVVNKFTQHPTSVTDDAVSKLEYGSFAILEYLESLLAGKPVSSVGLFSQFREIKALAGFDKSHPADLWFYQPFVWHDPDMPFDQSLTYTPEVRHSIDSALLKLIQTSDSAASNELNHICLGLTLTQVNLKARVFWKICAAFFEAIGQGRVPVDLYTKRATSGIVVHYNNLKHGDWVFSDKFMHNLLFFCDQAQIENSEVSPCLSVVKDTWSLTTRKPIDYSIKHYGHFDPALLALSRKRILVAKDLWTLLSSGDIQKIRSTAEQFKLVSESLLSLYPSSKPLAEAILKACDSIVLTREPPPAEMAMEVATAILYLETVFEGWTSSDLEMEERAIKLAQRMERVRNGGQSETVEPWIEELYRRVSDKESMGSVVGELRICLTEVEKSIDQYFRSPDDKQALSNVPGKLGQMRGIFSVLGLDQAASAVVKMREKVEDFELDNFDFDNAKTVGQIDKFGNNLGALGFLIDMLNYQPALVKKLFVYDSSTGDLNPLMGRQTTLSESATKEITLENNADFELLLENTSHGFIEAIPSATIHENALFEQIDDVSSIKIDSPNIEDLKNNSSINAKSPTSIESQPLLITEHASTDTLSAEALELRSIFLEEAAEVIAAGLQASNSILQNADNVETRDSQSVLRRVFHTLKGSARMVGLDEFGEAGWAFEQMVNTRLSDQKQFDHDFCKLSIAALNSFSLWVKDIQSNSPTHWRSETFRNAADLMRIENRCDITGLVDEKFAIDSESLQTNENEVTDDEALMRSLEEFELLEIPESLSHDIAAEPSEPVVPIVPVVSVEPVEPVVPIAETKIAQNSDTPLEDKREINKDVDLTPTTVPVIEHKPVLVSTIDDEQFKVIGNLKIGIPLYNVYLNEADEWSRCLVTELEEWSLEPHRSIPLSTVSYAHSLAGSSATVGFVQLSKLAKLLEHKLDSLKKVSSLEPTDAKILLSSAEECRRLLHQFAAGFLVEPKLQVIQVLESIKIKDVKPKALSTFASDKVEVNKVNQIDSKTKVDKVEKIESEVTSTADTIKKSEKIKPKNLISQLPRESRNIDINNDNDIEHVDALDADLAQIFEEEALELLPALGAALRQWLSHPENISARSEILRVLHTLKGSSRLAGAMRLGELAHRMESEIEELGKENLTKNMLEPLNTRLDILQQSFDALRHSHTESDAIESQDEKRSELENSNPLLQSIDQAATVKVNASTSTSTSVTSETTKSKLAATEKFSVKPAATNSIKIEKKDSRQSVRVRARLLDRLVNQAGEVMLTRTRIESELGQLRGSLGDLTGNLDRLRQQLRDVEFQAETQMQTRMEQSKDTQQGFDPLEFDRFTRVQELTRMMAESVNDVATVQRNLQRTVDSTEDDLVAQARQTRDLQRDLLRTRMEEFESISDRLYRVVRQASKDTNKQVKLDIVGGSIEVDRGVLERMTPSFEHLLRNCVAHGIETSEKRIASGKEAIGTIEINLVQDGNDVVIEFKDDGAGLNYQNIREKAIAQKLIAKNSKLSDADTINLIFAPGLSTATTITELSGRGIGLDVVRTDIISLGGRIDVSSDTNKGSRFKLVLPLTTAVTQVVMMRSGNLSFGVPSHLVEVVRRAPLASVEEAYKNSFWNESDEKISFYWSGALLQASQRSSEPLLKTNSVIIFKSAGQRTAMHVDEIFGNKEVVIKNLGPQLSRLPGLAGMAILVSGAVALIYNPVALAAVYGSSVLQYSPSSGQEIDTSGKVPALAKNTVEQQTPLVLVVDDSITVRRVTQRMLQREGFRVVLAVDGLQAIEKLNLEVPDIVLSDIEMPRMDGFDLVRNIRSDSKLKHLPIVMITSRIAEKHKDLAKELGVNDYLGKPYSEEGLLNVLRQHTAKKIPSPEMH